MLHIDGHDKIKRHGFAIHAGIGGFSRKLLWLEVCTTNNDPYMIAHHYIKTFQKLKYIPTIVRSDLGTENLQVEAIHVALRYKQNDEFAGLKSFLKGKSTHNQRIESFWVQLQRLCTFVYMKTFKNLVETNILDLNNKIQIECLRYFFGPVIRHDLQCKTLCSTLSIHHINNFCYSLSQQFSALQFFSHWFIVYPLSFFVFLIKNQFSFCEGSLTLFWAFLRLEKLQKKLKN